MFDRLKLLIGDEGVENLKNSHVLLVGLGGVGGIVLESLVRSGVGNISICDYDVFDETNLNRQILSSRDNIGMKKTLVGKSRMLNINPDVNIDVLDFKICHDTINSLETYDYIIDACDDTDAKILLYKFAFLKKIKIISSMGMGNRFDITKISITKLNRTINDPLAKKIRFLCKKNNIDINFLVLCSSELPFKKDDNTVGSIFFVVNAAGIILSNFVIKELLKN